MLFSIYLDTIERSSRHVSCGRSCVGWRFRALSLALECWTPRWSLFLCIEQFGVTVEWEVNEIKCNDSQKAGS
jgi:hypothetical protein